LTTPARPPRTARPKAPTSPNAWRAAVQAKHLHDRMIAGELTWQGALRRMQADHDFRMRMLKRRSGNGR